MKDRTIILPIPLMMPQQTVLLSKLNSKKPICIVGDFNSRTGVLSDFVIFDDVIAATAGLHKTYNDMNSKYELEELGICTERFNLDT